MAKQKDTDTLAQYSAILADINAGKFSPVYILMGEEPYYSDVIITHFVNRLYIVEN